MTIALWFLLLPTITFGLISLFNAADLALTVGLSNPLEYKWEKVIREKRVRWFKITNFLFVIGMSVFIYFRFNFDILGSIFSVIYFNSIIVALCYCSYSLKRKSSSSNQLTWD